MTKKILSLFMALVMSVCSLTLATSVFAASGATQNWSDSISSSSTNTSQSHYSANAWVMNLSNQNSFYYVINFTGYQSKKSGSYNLTGKAYLNGRDLGPITGTYSMVMKNESKTGKYEYSYTLQTKKAAVINKLYFPTAQTHTRGTISSDFNLQNINTSNRKSIATSTETLVPRVSQSSGVTSVIKASGSATSGSATSSSSYGTGVTVINGTQYSSSSSGSSIGGQSGMASGSIRTTYVLKGTTRSVELKDITYVNGSSNYFVAPKLKDKNVKKTVASFQWTSVVAPKIAKYTGGVCGFKIEYSTDKNFKKNVKKITVKKNAKNMSQKLEGLKKNTKYYVRIRAYNNEKKTIYTQWKTFNFKTKK